MSTTTKPVVYLRGPEDDNPSEPGMKFRLTYEGELRPTQRDPDEDQKNPLAVHKQRIRRSFHRQLRELWATDRFLSSHRVYPSDHKISDTFSDLVGQWAPDRNKMVPLVAAVAAQYHEFGYRFIPLVRESWSLLCSLNVLVLRRDFPGPGIISADDIDNRIKTLIDALRRPRAQNELIAGDVTPGSDDDPFFVLMEDDSQVSHLSVEADRLLDVPDNENKNQRWTKVIVTIELRPYYVTMFNASLMS